MIIQTGIDLVEVERIQKSVARPGFLRRVFSLAEQQLFERRRNNPQTIAANFAAKEAFSKAMGTGVRGFEWNEVSLLRDELGKPYFVLSGNAKALCEQNGYLLSVSVTHTRSTAGAVVVAYSPDSSSVAR